MDITYFFNRNYLCFYQHFKRFIDTVSLFEALIVAPVTRKGFILSTSEDDGSMCVCLYKSFMYLNDEIVYCHFEGYICIISSPFPLYFCTNMPNACFFNPSKTKDLLSFTTIDPNRYAGDYLS